EGRPRLLVLEPREGFDPATVLRLAASAERGGKHPLSRALVQAAESRQIPLTEPLDVEELPGRGVRGVVEGRRVVLGTPHWLAEQEVAVGAMHDRIVALRDQGCTVLLLALDGRLAALLGVADPVREHAAAVLRP